MFFSDKMKRGIGWTRDIEPIVRGGGGSAAPGARAEETLDAGDVEFNQDQTDTGEIRKMPAPILLVDSLKLRLVYMGADFFFLFYMGAELGKRKAKSDARLHLMG